MLNIIYRLILAINATSWMVVIFGIKEKWNFGCGPTIITSIALLLLPIAVSVISLLIMGWFKLSEDKLICSGGLQLADNEFLPVYLGYFFVALSIPDVYTLLFVYIMVLVFSFLSQTQYFNPIFLLVGYHFYHVQTEQGTHIFIISHGEVVRNAKDIVSAKMLRINDTTYITRKEKINE